MLADFGFTAMFLSLLCAIYAAVLSLAVTRTDKRQWLASARNAAIAAWPLLTLACFCLIYLLLNEHFEIEYVARVSSRAMPWYLKATALWGGQAGSLLFWAWLMSGYTALVMMRNWRHERDMQPYVIAATMCTLAFFIGLNVFVENPFTKLWIDRFGQTSAAFLAPSGAQPFTPTDGQGLNPLLRHPGMIIHPPMLYLGFVGFVIPYSFAIAALAVRRSDDIWIRITRRWTLISWLFLSLGLLLGGRWAYDVLGWGGYWGWDPVEIAAFMPWLTGTAFLHSVMIQEKRGMFKRWNMILVILTYALVIFGTFLTRSGVLSSVHAFAQSTIGPLFFIFIGITFAISLKLLFRGWESLYSENMLTSWLSREGLFLLNNLLFMGILLACFWGVIYPLISELATGQKVTVGPPFYERTTGPQFAALLFLMGVAPLAAWRVTTVRRLGNIIWKPTVFSILAPLCVLLAGVTNPAALLSLWLTALVLSVTLYEFFRGASARGKSTGDNILRALWDLIAHNRRRYGGYVIHLGVTLMAVGIIGIEMFQTETQGTLAQGEQIELGDYVMIYNDLVEFPTDDNR
ncbi:MAG: cytochrome c biogenesis protein CcsA, partial [Gammaproteobacteria bacterium]|nr:cytochrome c biogenesis protein CcsA [Gammaproteobacteria bacterium]